MLNTNKLLKMKKLILAMLAISMAVFTSCEGNDDEKKNTFEANAANFQGEIPAGDDIVLDPSKKYMLTGKLVVKNGAKLTIPAGTVIEATATTQTDIQVRYIAVERGAKIFVNGTTTSPVVMTSTVKAASSWGGFVICGAAPTNKGVDVAAEVSDLLYGGTKADDNSGVIRYLRVEYTGYKYTDTKEFNGVSLFGVGSGTVFEYVVSYKGGDDGIEFFGGTVNGSYLVSVDSEDDGIDFADGWVGTGNNWYVYNASKSGIEGSNNGDNGAANTPMTNATLKNLTIYMMGEKPFYMKEGAGKMNIENMVIGGLVSTKAQPYFFADATDSHAFARIDAGDIVTSKIKFVGDFATGQSEAVAGLTINKDATATGAGNGINKPSWMPDALNQVNATTKVIN
jgi:hypothetical protein